MGGVFLNAYLPDIAPREKIGRISGYGWSFGYIGGLLALAICFVLFISNDNPSNPITREKSVTKDALWGNCLLYIKDRIQDQAFQTWFDGIIATSLNEEGITLQVPNQFHYEWLESKYRNLIDNALKKYSPHPLVVNYSIVISDKRNVEVGLIPQHAALGGLFFALHPPGKNKIVHGRHRFPGGLIKASVHLDGTGGV